jgi:hypothetical protein
MEIISMLRGKAQFVTQCPEIVVRFVIGNDYSQW